MWEAIAGGPHEWVAILEDDVTLFTRELLTQLPPIPEQCDFLYLVPRSVTPEAVCAEARVNWGLIGFGTWGYVINRRRAQLLVDGSRNGFSGPVDLHLYSKHWGCVTQEPRLEHHMITYNDTGSIRQFLNGQVDKHNDQAPA